MKYAFVNGYILDGTKDMQIIKDKTVLVDGKKINIENKIYRHCFRASMFCCVDYKHLLCQ